MFIRSVCLTDMCLNVIVNNLEVIIVNENIPQISVDFLFRAYAGRVYEEYRQVNKVMKEDVMLWFLNPHAKEITLPRKLWLSEKILDKLQSIGMGITSLNLHRSSASENVLNAIVRCVPCVKILNLSHTKCTNGTLSVIKETCENLENLTLSYCHRITDDGLKNLCGKMNQSLKILDLTCSGVEYDGPDIILRRMYSLECIRYDGISDILMDKIGTRRKYNITELMYDSWRDKDFKGMRNLTKMCPKIKKLHFESIVKEKVLKECAGFQQLEELKLKVSHTNSYNVRRSNFLAPFLPISLNLRTLILSCMQIPTVMLIENFKNLEKLYLKKVSFTSFKKEDIKCTENKLDVLVIKSTHLEVSTTTYKAITLLISLSKNVTKLDLSRNIKMPPALFDVILNSMKHLSSISFYRTPVRMVFLIPFFDMHSLKKIITDYPSSYVDNYVKPKLPPKSSSTLSWRHVYHEDSDYKSPFWCHDCNSDQTDDHDSMDDSVTSNHCFSDQSELDNDRDYFLPDDIDHEELKAMGFCFYDSEESDETEYEESDDS